MYELKKLSSDALASALDKAVHYRVLNEPVEAESICRDVIAVDPNHQQALITLLLALTDQFPRGIGGRAREAREIAARLDGDYERAYYAGIIAERQAKCQHHQRTPGCGHLAYDGLVKAMELYEEAEAVRASGNDDAILRWNACARFIEANADIEPEPDTGQQSMPMLE